jgi:hypothetical protein
MASSPPIHAIPGVGRDGSVSPGYLRWLAWPCAFALMMALLLGPSLWNGFPLIFADTGGYLARPFLGNLELGRSALYGLFLALGIPLDFWPVIIIQAVATVWIVILMLRAHGLGGRPGLALLVVGILALLTSLPWYVGQLMPDVFVPLAVLGLDLLAFRANKLRIHERIGVAAILAFAITTHMAILALTVGLVIVFALMRWLGTWLDLPRPRLLLPSTAIGAGILLALLSNLFIAGTLTFTPGGSTFLFGRMVQSGIVDRYLADKCPDPSLRLCAYRNEMPKMADDWLWWGESPLHKLGGWEAFEPEAQRIIAGSLLLYPGAHLVSALAATAEQLVTLKTGEGINPENNWHAEWMLKEYAPRSTARFQAAAQQHDRFGFTLINIVQVPIAFLTAMVLPILVVLLRRRRRHIAALAFTVAIALVGNAAICGIFSNPNARYQSRIMPAAVLTVMIAGLSLQRRRSPVILQRSSSATARSLLH